MLESIVRSKAAQGQALRSIFLLLDCDFFGDRPLSNRSIQTLWPPSVTGDTAWRFTWRYLTAIQPKAWGSELALAARRLAGPEIGLSAAAAAERPGAAPRAVSNNRERIVARPGFRRQLALLARFVELCRTHRITLTIALSPLSRNNAAQYDPGDLIEAARQIGAVVPVWDFGAPEWLTARTDLWYDESHFKPEVANMMLDRIFRATYRVRQTALACCGRIETTILFQRRGRASAAAVHTRRPNWVLCHE